MCFRQTRLKLVGFPRPEQHQLLQKVVRKLNRQRARAHPPRKNLQNQLQENRQREVENQWQERQRKAQRERSLRASEVLSVGKPTTQFKINIFFFFLSPIGFD